MKNLKILSALPIVILVLTGPGCSNKTVEMQATIDELNTKNTDLERKVADLQSYLDESTDNYDHLMAFNPLRCAHCLLQRANSENSTHVLSACC